MTLTSFHLKIIALTTMFIDHLGAVFSEYFGFGFRIIGRVAFPIFICLVAEGFKHTKSPEKFLLRLGIFAVLSEPAFDWAIRGIQLPPSFSFAEFHLNVFLNSLWASVDFFNNTNIFYTLFLGGMAIYAFKMAQKEASGHGLTINMFPHPQYNFRLGKERAPNKINAAMAYFAAITCVLGFMWVAESMLTTDYGAYGVAFIFLMYVIKPLKLRLAVMAVMCVFQHRYLVWWTIQHLCFNTPPVPGISLLMIPATLVPVLLVAFYNGKRGPSFKWFFYSAYPLHLFIFALAAKTF